MKAFAALYVASAREFLRDRMTFLFTLLLPLALTGFFGLIFSGVDGPTTVRLGLWGGEEGPAGREIARQLAQPAQSLTVRTGEREELLASLAKGDLDVVLALPKELSESLAAARASQVEVYYDPSRQSSAGAGLLVAREIVSQMNVALSGATPTLGLTTRAVQGDRPRMVDFVIPGMLGVAMLWLGLFGTAMPLVALREQHVLRRLGATPLSRGTLLASQVSWRLTVGLAQALAFLVFGHFAFGLAVSGSPVLLALAVVLGTLVFVTMGYLLAGLSPSQEGATAITQLVNFPMMMLSGAFFDIQLLPPFLRPVVDVLPLTYLGDAFRQIMAGFPPLYPLWLDFAVLVGWLVAMVGVSLRVFRWE